jgi:hypothetical protein
VSVVPANTEVIRVVFHVRPPSLVRITATPPLT